MLIMHMSDQIQDHVLATSCRTHDRRDRFQRNALVALLSRCCRDSPWTHPHHILGRVRNVHVVVTCQVQDETSGSS